jgi:hypothetical protein
LRQHLDRDVFDDVIEMRAFFKPFDESADAPALAEMLAQTGKFFEQPTVKGSRFAAALVF